MKKIVDRVGMGMIFTTVSLISWYVVRPLSTVEYMSIAAPSVSGLFTLGWMCPLKREQTRHECESELRLTNSL